MHVWLAVWATQQVIRDVFLLGRGGAFQAFIEENRETLMKVRETTRTVSGKLPST